MIRQIAPYFAEGMFLAIAALAVAWVVDLSFSDWPWHKLSLLLLVASALFAYLRHTRPGTEPPYLDAEYDVRDVVYTEPGMDEARAALSRFRPPRGGIEAVAALFPILITFLILILVY